jgi:aryl-alcohol dehydrogenase-like predicted oxidoreductase
MTFGETWGWGADKPTSRAIFDRFAGRGGNFIDTSVNYTDGTSEEFIGEFLEGQRDRFVVATKYTLTQPNATDPNSGGNHRKNMRLSVERSLRRLRTDYIDVLYLHAWDYLTPVEEIARGMDDLVRAGKVLYLAFSDTPAYIVAEANARAELMGWSRFIGWQVPYSLLSRALEREILPAARHWEMAVLLWGILEAGILSGKFRSKPTDPTRLDHEQVKLGEQAQRTVETVGQIAAETGRSMSQVAINWVRQSSRAQMLPILGGRTIPQIEDNLGVLDWSLTDEQITRLDAVSAIPLGFPHDFLPGNRYIFGATYDQIDKRG